MTPAAEAARRRSDLEGRVGRIVGELSRGGPAGGDDLDCPWGGLGLDSLDLLELAVRCEDEFGRSIPDAELVRWGRPRDVVRYLLAVEPAASDVA